MAEPQDNPRPEAAEAVEPDPVPSVSEPQTAIAVPNDELTNKGKNARCRVELSPHVMTLIRGTLADAVKNISGASYVSDGAALQVALGFAWRLEKGAALVCGPSQVCPRIFPPLLKNYKGPALVSSAAIRLVELRSHCLSCAPHKYYFVILAAT